jgi:hypothetical protein
MIRSWTALIVFVVAATLATGAEAYVGPGAGLSLLGAVWAFIAAIGTAIAFIVAWPIRKLLRNRKRARARIEPTTPAE